MNDEFQRQATSVFQQWDSDLEKTKDQEEKLAVSSYIRCNSYYVVYIFML